MKWQINEFGDCVGNGSRVVAEIPNNMTKKEWAADAALIAAAPEMLAALDEMLSLDLTPFVPDHEMRWKLLGMISDICKDAFLSAGGDLAEVKP